MEWVETTGRSVEEAKEAALDELGVDEHDAEFEVLAEARIGLFGRVRSEARVRARVRPTAPRSKEENRDRRRRRRQPSGQPSAEANGRRRSAPTGETPEEASKAVPAPVARAGSSSPAKETAGSRGAKSQASSPDDRTAPGDTPVEPPAQADGAETAQVSGGGRRKRQRSRPQPRAADDLAPAATGVPISAASTLSAQDANGDGQRRRSQQQNPEEAGQVEVALAEQGEVAQRFLEGLVAEFGLGAEVQVSQVDNDTIELGLHGTNLGVLIGQKGTTLLALQDLTRTVVQRRTGATNGRLFVDVAGYRRKRHEALARFAQQVAAQVIAEGKPKALEPMSASDRKVVHDTINALEGVATTSEGEEPSRYVVVLPRTS